METKNEKFDLWCVVELFGHSQISGKCSEYTIAGTNMLKIDVPETSKNGPFTKFYGSSAIYAISPVSELVAIAKAEALNVTPTQVWNIQTYLDKQNLQMALPSYQDKIGDDNDDNAIKF